MGHFSMEKSLNPGSVLGRNQQLLSGFLSRLLGWLFHCEQSPGGLAFGKAIAANVPDENDKHRDDRQEIIEALH
jgi:hypothetical protein